MLRFHFDLVLKWFEENFMFLNTDKCHFRGRKLSMYEGGPKGFCGGHEIFWTYIDGP